MAVADGHRESLISLAEALGLNERERAAFVAGRDGPSVPGGDVFDEMVDFGRRSLGLTEAGAKAFAIGRDGSEGEARRQFREAQESAGGDLPALTGDQRTQLLEAFGGVRAAWRRMGASEATAHRWATESLQEQLNRTDVPADRRVDRAAVYLREVANVVSDGKRR